MFVFLYIVMSLHYGKRCVFISAFLATIIKGKDVHVFASYENLTLTCEYESISSIPSSDLVKLKFYDKDDVNFGMERGFMHSHRFLSANKISSVLIKHMVDSFDAGTYICKFNNDNSKRFKTEVVIVHCKFPEVLYRIYKVILYCIMSTW